MSDKLKTWNINVLDAVKTRKILSYALFVQAI